MSGVLSITILLLFLQRYQILSNFANIGKNLMVSVGVFYISAYIVALT